MKGTREPAVAGLFYPAEHDELERMVASFIAPAPTSATAPKALIVPHAGYPYSGPIAGSGYAQLEPARRTITRVILLGPAHRVYVHGLAAPTHQYFATPLGVVPVDHQAIQSIRNLAHVHLSDAAHAEEHGLEVHLPFLQRMLDSFSIVPLVVGETTPEDIADVLERLWGGEETLIVISSDLSHYHDYDTARRLDAATSRAITALHADAIGPEQACGRLPIQGLLLVARKKGLRAHLLDMRNSGDTAGPRDRVVGYGAYAFGHYPNHHHR